MKLEPAARYLKTGKVANLDQLASVRTSMILDGPAAGTRAIDLRVLGGLDVRILPDRGFDLGAAWYRGLPLAWISPVGEAAPLRTPTGTSWLDAFGGGLMTTCGLRNVGAPSEGHGLHGAFSSLRASNTTVSTLLDDDEVVLTASATIDEVSALGPHLRVARTIKSRTGSGFVELTDSTTNMWSEPEETPLLYHVNLGAPLYGERARLTIESLRVTPRPGDDERATTTWMAGPEPAPRSHDMLLEHSVQPSSSGWASAAVTNEDIGVTFTLCWEQRSLPRFHQWIHPAAGVYVLGLEPANCSVMGRAADREANQLPSLAPQETRVTRLHFHVANEVVRH